MGIYLDGLIEAKYKNAPFYVRKESIANIGQKYIIHDYPNSSTRYAEPQGRAIFEETIDIFFHGINYSDNFKIFMRAIQDSAPGRLFLPTFGIFENVVALPANASADQAALGEIQMTVTFTETIEKPSPIEILDTEENVAEQAQAIRESLLDQFEINYDPPVTRNNITTASSDSKNLADSLNKLTQAQIEYNRFIRSVDRYLSNASELATLLLNPGQPVGYLQSFALGFTGTEAFNLFAKVAVTGNNLSNSMNDIDSGINPVESTLIPDIPGLPEIDANLNFWDEDTFERIQRNNNRAVFANTFRLVGLIGMYERAAERDYTTVDEIRNIKLTLNNYYTEIIENDTTGVIIPELKNDIVNLKNRTNDVLDQKAQSAFNVIEIVIKNNTPATLLAYQFYGEYIKTEAEFEYLTGLIIDLNRELPAHKLSGTVRILQIG